MNIHGYLRVSTGEQADSGLGVAAQRAAIEAETDRRGWPAPSWHADEGVSGSTPLEARAGMADVLGRIREGDVLIVAKLDRAARSVVALADLLDRAQAGGWAFVALDLGVDTSTPTGRLVANIMGSVAQWEREIIGQRTREALAAKKADGAKLGRPRLIPDEIVYRIRRERERGMTMQQIADGLNRDRVPTAHNGAKWHRSTVAGVL